MEIWIYKRIRLFKKNVDIQKGASILGKCRYTEGDVYFRKMWIYREWVHFIQKKKKKQQQSNSEKLVRLGMNMNQEPDGIDTKKAKGIFRLH